MARSTSQPRKRSNEIILVGYFLARCTDFSDGKKPRPPAALGVSRWNECYDLFFDGLAEGRETEHFRHTLRNTRDTFDSLFDNGRVGWSEGQKRGQVLSDRDIEMHQKWKDQTDQALSDFVLQNVLGGETARTESRGRNSQP